MLHVLVHLDLLELCAELGVVQLEGVVCQLVDHHTAVQVGRLFPWWPSESTFEGFQACSPARNEKVIHMRCYESNWFCIFSFTIQNPHARVRFQLPQVAILSGHSVDFDEPFPRGRHQAIGSFENLDCFSLRYSKSFCKFGYRNGKDVSFFLIWSALKKGRFGVSFSQSPFLCGQVQAELSWSSCHTLVRVISYNSIIT